MAGQHKFSDFLKLSNFFYASIGIQPFGDAGSSRGKSLASLLVFYVGVINMNFVLFSEITYVVVSFVQREHILEAIMNMSYIGFVLVGTFKMFFVYLQKQSLIKFAKGMEDIFPTSRVQQEQYKLQNYLAECNRVTNGFSLLYMILIWTYNLSAIVQYMIYDRWLQIRDIGQQLPYNLYVHYEWRNHWSYYLLYASDVLAGYTSATGQISGDIMLCAFTTQLVMHYDFVCQSLTDYQVKVMQPGVKKEEGYVQDLKFLQDMIRYHERLLQLTEEIREIFSLPLFLNFSASSFIICFVGFQMTIGVDLETMMKLGLFLFCSIAQVYLICYYSQKLMDASINVANAVYNQNWSNADVRYQKMLVLMAERAQKPAQLKATTFVLISRATMTELMQLSYKFFALLRTLYVK